MIVKHRVRRIPRDEWSVYASPMDWRGLRFPWDYADWQKWTTHEEAKDEAEAREIADRLRRRLPQDIYKVEIIHVEVELADVGETELIDVNRSNLLAPT